MVFSPILDSYVCNRAASCRAMGLKGLVSPSVWPFEHGLSRPPRDVSILSPIPGFLLAGEAGTYYGNIFYSSRGDISYCASPFALY
jgi:hypothetical protein